MAADLILRRFQDVNDDVDEARGTSKPKNICQRRHRRSNVDRRSDVFGHICTGRIWQPRDFETEFWPPKLLFRSREANFENRIFPLSDFDDAFDVNLFLFVDDVSELESASC